MITHSPGSLSSFQYNLSWYLLDCLLGLGLGGFGPILQFWSYLDSRFQSVVLGDCQ